MDLLRVSLVLQCGTVWYSVVQCGTVCYGGGVMEPHNSPAFDEFTDIKCDGDGGVMSPGSPLLYMDYVLH